MVKILERDAVGRIFSDLSHWLKSGRRVSPCSTRPTELSEGYLRGVDVHDREAVVHGFGRAFGLQQTPQGESADAMHGFDRDGLVHMHVVLARKAAAHEQGVGFCEE